MFCGLFMHITHVRVCVSESAFVSLCEYLRRVRFACVFRSFVVRSLVIRTFGFSSTSRPFFLFFFVHFVLTFHNSYRRCNWIELNGADVWVHCRSSVKELLMSSTCCVQKSLIPESPQIKEGAPTIFSCITQACAKKMAPSALNHC